MEEQIAKLEKRHELLSSCQKQLIYAQEQIIASQRASLEVNRNLVELLRERIRLMNPAYCPQCGTKPDGSV